MVLRNNNSYKILKDRMAKFETEKKEFDKNKYFEHSISAYFILAKVYKMLNIDEIPSQSVQNGNVSKILSEGNKIIDAKFGEESTRQLVKYYMARSFFDEYDLESDDFTNELAN